MRKDDGGPTPDLPMTCFRCQVVKVHRDFSVRDRTRPKPICYPCHAERVRQHRINNPEHVKAQQRRRYRLNPSYSRDYCLRAKYGITLIEWDKMFEEQGKSCCICKSNIPGGRGWQTDHDHLTGQICSILCHSCNSGIGHFRENPLLMEAAIEYLIKHKGVKA